MVTATGYYPNASNTTWQEQGTWAQGGRGTHAEIQGWTAMSRTAHAVYMYVQDGAPCEACHPRFVELSNEGQSFIFIITRAGYAVQAGVNVNYQLASQFDAAHPNFVLCNHALHLDPAELPVALYFHGGLVFLDSRPHDFPACPSIIPYM